MNRDELRRLEKAAREKDKKHLAEWAANYENQVNYLVRREYEKHYQDEIKNSIDNFCLALAYTAHFCEATLLDENTLPEFMEDFFVTVDMFRTGEYKPEDYKEELEKCGFVMDDLLYKPREHKIITVCGNFDKLLFNKLTNENNIVIFSNNNKEMTRDKIKISDIVYISNKERFKTEIEIAKEFNKIIRYMEDEDSEHNNSN